MNRSSVIAILVCLVNLPVAASPSLSYYDNFLLKQLTNIPVNNSKAKLYITIGRLENMNGFNFFIKELSANKFHDMDVKSEIYNNFSHMETAVRTFEEAFHGSGDTK